MQEGLNECQGISRAEDEKEEEEWQWDGGETGRAVKVQGIKSQSAKQDASMQQDAKCSSRTRRADSGSTPKPMQGPVRGGIGARGQL
jgi:hypothetical protein